MPFRFAYQEVKPMLASLNRIIKSLPPALAVSGLLVIGAATPSVASAFTPVTCHATGARWHLAEYFDKEGVNPEASGNQYRYYAPDEAFCHTMNPWIPKLTGAANDKNFEHDNGSEFGGIRIPPGYDLIPRYLTPPGYNCIAMVNDPRAGHHHDNAHWGSCTLANGSRRGAWSWFSVLPPETS